MDEGIMNGCAALADAFDYPTPGRLEALKGALPTLPNPASKKAYTAFLDGVSPLSAGEWEELYTRTLDLNPPAAPYIGYQTWGESYQRGAFLARLNRELLETGVDAGGELPDHLAPVLRYLARTPSPLPELVELCEPALQRMITGLRRSEPDNPYVELLEAVSAVYRDLKSKIPTSGKENS
jgi:nitrate reductase molybdenum cofactor assembly chaperone NarJ/NarW